MPSEEPKDVSMQNLARLMAMLDGNAADTKVNDDKPKKSVEHKFWKTQPVAQPGDSSSMALGPIHPDLAPEQVRATPYPLPPDFTWVTIDMDDEKQLIEVYELLTANYVEDDDATMRFKYSPAFLHWVLRHPGYDKSWHVGVRVVSTNKLVAFIAGIPQELRVRDVSRQAVEINFLCVHKKLRSKRFAPVLIKEVTRRCNLKGIFQAIYTVGSDLPTPVSCARYYHRTLNAPKLLEIGFSAVPQGMSREAHIGRFALPSNTQMNGLREMRKSDVPRVAQLLRRFLRRFDMAPRYTDEEVGHLLLSGKGEESSGSLREGQVTWTYVVEQQDGRISDFFSFYSLPSSILDHEKHHTLEAAYLFYYASDCILPAAPTSDTCKQPSSQPAAYHQAREQGNAPWKCAALSKLNQLELADEQDIRPWSEESVETREKLKARLNLLMSDMLILAKQQNFDVVNCLTVLDNSTFATDLKFGPGDGFLRFYLFNWRVQPIAGGMGQRAGERDLDPNAVSGESVPNPTLFGSGNGIVMV
ncbi:glycylpeptide N-tetradecanoyltransferase [Malassezia psittaci]|uniref:Glycylpeptide N-tetradecanoyltransferase n=1 Tax=Malassezia psittaci TaxID=1821823 RepID=A0AAF0FIN3_9BASI|nr:glycylpeptide N-tetradecanoyltransferase [Malassezia psittaci]